jgi:glucose/arabinose dehydrogenase
MRQLRPLIIAVAVLVLAPTAATAAILPPGFQETAAFTGLVNPTSVRFAADGRVFVAEKRGRVLVYDSLADPTPSVLLDVSTAVHDFWDRGLLGMALDPQFTSGRPFVYVLYTYDKDPSSPTVPRWGDGCPTPPGATADGCVVSGRLSRISPDGTETPLITDWCQQYPSHSIGDLAFGPDGALYLSAGDGASFNFADYGQDGNPVNRAATRSRKAARCAARTCAPPATRPGPTARSCASTRTPARRCPTTRRPARPTR